MLKRFLLLSVLALPAFARVISYAPYTDRVAMPSIQDRTSRHFVLIESTPEAFLARSPGELVLYDSAGAEEPRVITPATPKVWEQAAVYQKPGNAPVILAVAPGMVAVSEGGAEWRVADGLGYVAPAAVLDVDTGGPFTNGLFVPIMLGNDEWPFIVTLHQNGVWAIDRTGRFRPLSKDYRARVIGRNAAGDRFLIQTGTTLSSVTLDGRLTKLADLPVPGSFAGWITPGGEAYIEVLRNDGRSLHITAAGRLEPVASAMPAYPPQGETLPPLRLFAVPTHDYNGAWIVQREPGRPTRLLRHTPNTVLQTMWSDDAAPEVEALIAGRSGQTVLVQVHREREQLDDEPIIIDPALAVWRVGQPAPKSYEELYLNEQWNKGFVVVDPDTMESGATFVFNSGFREIQPPPPSRVSAPIGGGGDVVQEWGVVRGSLRQRLVLPGVARLRGAYDSFWQTDLTLYNPVDTRQEVELRFAPLGTDGSVSTTVTLEPRELRAVPDVLGSLFSVDAGGGTLHVVPQIGVNAVARTYSRRGDGGTFGFGMQAIDIFNAAGPRFSLSFAGAFPGAHFRTNVLLTDTSGRGTEALLRLPAKPPLSTVGAPAAGTIQVSAYAGSASALEIEPTRGTAIATVVAIDNRSNDPTYFPPDLSASVPRVIPVIGHLDGAQGSKFRSDLYLYNPRGVSRSVLLTASPWNGSGRSSTSITLSAGESRVIPDALYTLFRMRGLARLRYANADRDSGEGVRVTSRTYTVDANGATYGCLVPPLNGFQIAVPGERLEIIGISAGPGFRTNIGLIDLSDNSWRNATVRLTIVGDRGQVLETKTVSIPARGGIQLNDVFGVGGGSTPPPAALLFVDVVEGLQIGAYATLTDNITNDSVYLASQLGAKPDSE